MQNVEQALANSYFHPSLQICKIVSRYNVWLLLSKYYHSIGYQIWFIAYYTSKQILPLNKHLHQINHLETVEGPELIVSQYS